MLFYRWITHRNAEYFDGGGKNGGKDVFPAGWPLSKNDGKYDTLMEKSRERFAELTLLKASERNYPASPDQARLETFQNLYADRDYIIEFDCPEYTSLCPVTGQPDFGHLTIRYVPDNLCIESKSLKLFLYSFRNTNTFHEESVNTVLDAVVGACRPRAAEVVGRFRPRGGIAIHVKACYGDKIDG